MISQEIETIIKKAKLCFVATVNPDGSPNLSPKASLVVALKLGRHSSWSVKSPDSRSGLGDNFSGGQALA